MACGRRPVAICVATCLTHFGTRSWRPRGHVQTARRSYPGHDGACLIPRLPRPSVVLLARALGWLGFHCSGKQRVLALSNINLALAGVLSKGKGPHCSTVFPDFRAGPARSALVQPFLGLARGAYVLLDASFERLFRTRPAIIVTAHFGNWEALGLAIARRGYPVVSVAAPLANPFVDLPSTVCARARGNGLFRRRAR